jgi:hypothetical protein
MRKCLEVRNIGVTEIGMTLADREGNTYHWVTKNHSHPLFFTNDWIEVRMTIFNDSLYSRAFAKNVRLISKEKDYRKNDRCRKE